MSKEPKPPTPSPSDIRAERIQGAVFDAAVDALKQIFIADKSRLLSSISKQEVQSIVSAVITAYHTQIHTDDGLRDWLDELLPFAPPYDHICMKSRSTNIEDLL